MYINTTFFHQCHFVHMILSYIEKVHNLHMNDWSIWGFVLHNRLEYMLWFHFCYSLHVSHRYAHRSISAMSATDRISFVKASGCITVIKVTPRGWLKGMDMIWVPMGIRFVCCIESLWCTSPFVYDIAKDIACKVNYTYTYIPYGDWSWDSRMASFLPYNCITGSITMKLRGWLLVSAPLVLLSDESAT